VQHGTPSSLLADFGKLSLSDAKEPVPMDTTDDMPGGESKRLGYLDKDMF